MKRAGVGLVRWVVVVPAVVRCVVVAGGGRVPMQV